MPPDTIISPIQPVMDSMSREQLLWERSVQQHLDSLGEAYLRSKAEEGPHYPFPEWQMFLIIFMVLAASAWFYIIRPSLKMKKGTGIKRLVKNGSASQTLQEMQYDHWLTKYNPYYNSLSAPQKKRFIFRVQHFMQSKAFCFHAMVEEEYIPVLISGTAVQLTFGLRNYLLDYFDVIHVMRKEYVLSIDKETYYGHVSRNGIHISWNRFLEGYSDYTDSVNVGLHEMAHALQFDASLGLEDRHDRNFKERLNDFSEEGREVFRAMRNGASHILDDYAATNFDEFWAVSVETFFENPTEFKIKLPRLYGEICELLNQDPEQPGTILNTALA